MCAFIPFSRYKGPLRTEELTFYRQTDPSGKGFGFESLHPEQKPCRNSASDRRPICANRSNRQRCFSSWRWHGRSLPCQRIREEAFARVEIGRGGGRERWGK